MDHSYFKDRISGYFDRQLPPEELEAVRRHLEQCRECRDLLGRLEKLGRLVDQHEQLGGDQYWERSARTIEQRLGFGEKGAEVTDITPSSWKGLAGKVVAVAASVAILTFIALYQKDIRDEMSAPSRPSAADEIIRDTEPLPVSEEIAAEPRGLEMSGRGDAIGREQAPEAAEQAAVPSIPSTEPGKGDKKAADRPITEKVSVPDEEPAETAAQMQLDLVETTAVSMAEPGTGRVVPQVQPARLEKAETAAVSLQQAVRLVEAESVKADQFTVQDAAAESRRLKAPARAVEPQGAPSVALVADTVSLSVGPAVIPDEWLQPVSLKTWRQRRDSLQTLYADRTSPHLGLAAAKARQEDTALVSQNVGELVLHCHYQIARLTAERDEREEAISHISREAEQAGSPLRGQARNYLELLGITVK